MGALESVLKNVGATKAEGTQREIEGPITHGRYSVRVTSNPKR
jgi:hypothetical protein